MALPYLQQIFDIGDYEGDMQLKADIDRQCGILYRSWKYELHSHYLELLEQGVPRPQDHSAEGCDPANWQLMISECWESPAWKVTLGCYIQQLIIFQRNSISNDFINDCYCIIVFLCRRSRKKLKRVEPSCHIIILVAPGHLHRGCL